jgi:hypothetical protein
MSLMNIGEGRPYFPYGRELNYKYVCTMKPYDILNVKNGFVKSVYCHRLYRLQSCYLLWCVLMNKILYIL